jgi:hypothetical protein
MFGPCVVHRIADDADPQSAMYVRHRVVGRRWGWRRRNPRRVAYRLRVTADGEARCRLVAERLHVHVKPFATRTAGKDGGLSRQSAIFQIRDNYSPRERESERRHIARKLAAPIARVSLCSISHRLKFWREVLSR